MDIKDKKLLRIFVLVLIVFLILNMVLVALKIISNFFFWIVLIVAAVFAYKILPKMKK